METAGWAGQGPRRMEGKLGGHKAWGDGAEGEQGRSPGTWGHIRAYNSRLKDRLRKW